MNDLNKRLLAFLAQHKDCTKEHMPLFMAIKDALEERRLLSQKLKQMAGQNRFVLYYNKKKELCVISDKPCHPYIIKEGENFKNIEALHHKTYFGEDGVNEALSS